MPLLTIASLTLHEVVRRRLLAAVGALTLLVIVATAWGFSKIAAQPHAGSQHDVAMAGTTAILVLLLAYVFGFVVAVGAAFLGAWSVAGDVESGLALALLPRPIRRSDFVLGKWLGLAVIVGLYTIVVGTIELAIVWSFSRYVPPHPALALAFLAAEGIVALSIGTLLSTRLAPITGGIAAIVLFGIAWIAGVAQSIATALGNPSILHATTAIGLVLPTDGLWRFAAFNLEPAVIAIAARANVGGSPFTVGAPPPQAFLYWTSAWLVAILLVSARGFARRDL